MPSLSSLGSDMRRRSKTGGEPKRARRRKAVTPKRTNAPKNARGRSSTVARGKTDVARLTRELHDALEQQRATAEVLSVINLSPGKLEPVFQTILGNATRICEAKFGTLYFFDGNAFSWAAQVGAPPEYADFLRQRGSFSPIYGTVLDHVTRTKAPAHIADDAASANPSAPTRLAGARSVLCVPMIKEDVLLGAIVIYRQEVRSFSDNQIELMQNFAAQAVIAIENTRLLHELRESLQQQTATADVLKVISRSAFDLQPVFDTIVQTASRLCDSEYAIIYGLKDDDKYHVVANNGADPVFLKYAIEHPLASGRGSLVGRTALERKTVHMPDCLADPEYVALEYQSVGHYRSMIGLPLLREGIPIGVITLMRRVVLPFTDKQIELVTTFADQAVIAIENARLFDEVQAKTRDLTEALTYQTGSANILRSIASSPTDVGPVLRTIVESACELCEAYDAVVVLKDGDDLRFSAHHGPIPMNIEKWPINRRWTAGRAFVDQKPIHVHDLLAEAAEFPDGRELSQRMGHRTILSVPLLREKESIGSLVLRRTEVNPFSDKQITLLQTFADQAVIAIQNARLFNETREALEQQKASADILAVISSSVADAQPVFDKILVSCKHLFGGDELDVLLVDEQGQLNIAAYISDSHDVWAATFPAPVERTPAGRAIRERRVMHWPDLVNGEDVPGVLRKMAKLIGYRSMVFAPMLWEGRGIGAIGVARSTGPFKPKELAMLQTFADQAVIAIQNARLFNETKEALERQTATAEILKVIASSPSDLQPVFEAIAERSNWLVDALSTTVFTLADGMMHLRAFTPTTPEADATLQATFPAPLSTFSWGESIRRGEIYHIIDSEHEPEGLRDVARLRGWRSCLCVPLLRDGKPIGIIGPTRAEPGPFTDHHVQLLQTFADQAVIAISNVGLFNEVQERTRELSKSLDDLRAAQDRLVQTQKLASLGQLTAGIAHEIKNPLNFVNNFSALSAELVAEMSDVLAKTSLDVATREELDELAQTLKSNLEKVVQHGKRADSIVKNMLLHSREGSGEHRSADINALVEESLNLAYHGARAEKSGFNVTLKRDLDPDAGAADLYPQEITRALLNLISNGFYAATQRKSVEGETFEPVLIAATKNLGKTVEIRIHDNGTGIPSDVREKMFNPFFTTKPSGEGTGLGLSMSHDIIVKQHGGSIDVETEPGLFTEFKIVLPRTNQR
jgi:GAF domain-containing protein